MKKIKIFWGLLAIIVLSDPGMIRSANAQCIQADVSLQTSISGSKQPTKRSNDVIMNSEPGCRGNASVTTGVQSNIGGTSPVEQHRRVRQIQRGSQGQGYSSNSTVQIRSNVGIDVYDPSARYRERN